MHSSGLALTDPKTPLVAFISQDEPGPLRCTSLMPKAADNSTSHWSFPRPNSTTTTSGFPTQPAGSHPFPTDAVALPTTRTPSLLLQMHVPQPKFSLLEQSHPRGACRRWQRHTCDGTRPDTRPRLPPAPRERRPPLRRPPRSRDDRARSSAARLAPRDAP